MTRIVVVWALIALVYLSESRPATIRMDKVSGTSTKAQWYHSRERTLLPIGEPAYTGAREFTTRTRGEHDLALVLDDTARELRSTDGITAIPVSNFLNSIGINSTFPDRGQPLQKTVEMIKYAGFRWVRGGIEGLTGDGPTTLQTYLELHRQTGVRFSWGLVSGGTDLEKLIQTARRLAAAHALLAFEGNNEPNNWGVTYQGEPGGGRAPRGWPSRNYNETCTSPSKAIRR